MGKKDFFEDGLALLIKMNYPCFDYGKLTSADIQLLEYIHNRWAKNLIKEYHIHKKTRYELSEKGKSYAHRVTNYASQSLDQLL